MSGFSSSAMQTQSAPTCFKGFIGLAVSPLRANGKTSCGEIHCLKALTPHLAALNMNKNGTSCEVAVCNRA
jgi:hypothetical protein